MESIRARIPAPVDGAAHYPASAAATPTARSRPRRPPAGVALLALALVALVAGCGRDDVRPTTRPAATVPAREWPVVAPGDPAAANAVLMRAISLVGTPYRYGGNTPEGGFDCSGLVNYVFRDMLDLKLPRTSRDLAAYQGPKIEPQRLAAADLVFFGSGSQVTHVGIYVGEGRFVHAPSTGGTVRLDHLDGSYWRRNYTGAKRVLR
ncbi:NlpC/P60 family protein [Luteimonas viscosa]|uniref:NlpC/P60 family protein n=1 Tax=Luteimonas viscosa TaxID=1132694 RepID=A0A5D4XM95_9GAMM|nr:C40 family peptidase [Luteimonas viscosa]TYT25254.1 NlpC/P60 family protein [Luteimonas viscosa]